MFRFLKKHIKKPNFTPPDARLEENKEEQISGNLDTSILYIKELLEGNEDFEFREFHIFGQFRAFICYFTGQANTTEISTDILKPLMYPPNHLKEKTLDKSNLLNILITEVLYHGKVTTETKWANLIQSMLFGETLVLIEGQKEAIQVGTSKRKERSIGQPETEQVIIGPREGFIEQIETNISLLRYRLPTPDFRVKTIQVGKLTKTKIAICYLEGIARPELVTEVENRLSKIETDAILGAGFIEQFIEDNPWSPFPQIHSTERPDRVVGNLIEGRVAILTEGTPFTLIVPVVFNQFYQTTEDYTSRFLMGSFIRVVRILALVFSLIVPSLYVSFIAFNPELLPTEFAVAVSGGRAGVPFPAVIEVLIIEVAMEVLREATVRLPQQVGGALSIVGVLIVGEAAVQAGFASPITVVVIALTTIGSFATPVYTAAFALRMLRFPILILSGVFGLYGLVIGVIIIFNHMLSLRSFGVPFMSPVAPENFQGMKDIVFRSPLWSMKKRPHFLHPENKTRMGSKPKEFNNVLPSTLASKESGNNHWEGGEGDAGSQRNYRDSGGSDNY